MADLEAAKRADDTTEYRFFLALSQDINKYASTGDPCIGETSVCHWDAAGQRPGIDHHECGRFAREYACTQAMQNASISQSICTKKRPWSSGAFIQVFARASTPFEAVHGHYKNASIRTRVLISSSASTNLSTTPLDMRIQVSEEEILRCIPTTRSFKTVYLDAYRWYPARVSCCCRLLTVPMTIAYL